MNYTTNETKAIQQVAAKIAKSTFGYWCCDGVNLFSIHSDYKLSIPCAGCGCWSISRDIFNNAVKASKELSIEYNQENNILSINGFKVTPNEYEKDENIVESTETPINKGSFDIDYDAKIVRSGFSLGVFLFLEFYLGGVKRQGGGGGLLPPSAGAYLFHTSYRAFFCLVHTFAPLH